MINKVDFYLVANQGTDPQGQFACRLLEKAYKRHHRVYVHCIDQQHCHRFDDLLWTFKDESFIPHHILGEGPTPPPPIQLGYEAALPHRDIVLSLQNAIVDFYQQFHRIIEVITDDANDKAQGRERYRYYQQQGATIQFHDMTDLSNS